MTTTVSRKKGIYKVWKDPEVVHTFDDGWSIIYVRTKEDLTTLGNLQHHCAGSQWVWAIEEKVYYFFALVDPDGNPHSTIHAKQASWIGKKHPRDGEPGTGLIPRADAYDYSVTRGVEPEVDSFEGRYHCYLPNRGNIPNGVDKDVWDTFVKSHKALSDNYRKNVGGIKIVGRRVKFDGKYIVVLSASGTYQSYGDEHRKRIGEFLNALNAKKKGE